MITRAAEVVVNTAIIVGYILVLALVMAGCGKAIEAFS